MALKYFLRLYCYLLRLVPYMLVIFCLRLCVWRFSVAQKTQVLVLRQIQSNAHLNCLHFVYLFTAALCFLLLHKNVILLHGW